MNQARPSDAVMSPQAGQNPHRWKRFVLHEDAHSKVTAVHPCLAQSDNGTSRAAGEAEIHSGCTGGHYAGHPACRNSQCNSRHNGRLLMRVLKVSVHHVRMRHVISIITNAVHEVVPAVQSRRIRVVNWAVADISVKIVRPGLKSARILGSEVAGRGIIISCMVIILPCRRVILHPRILEPIPIRRVGLGQDIAEAVVDDVILNHGGDADNVAHRAQVVRQIPVGGSPRVCPGQELVPTAPSTTPGPYK